MANMHTHRIHPNRTMTYFITYAPKFDLLSKVQSLPKQRELEELLGHCQEVSLNNSMTFDWKIDDGVCWMRILFPFVGNTLLPISKIHSRIDIFKWMNQDDHKYARFLPDKQVR